MAILFFAHSQVGKDASYMQNKLEAIINAKGASVVLSVNNPPLTSAVAPGAKDAGKNVYIDPAIDTTEIIDMEKKTTLAALMQSIINDQKNIGYALTAKGGSVSVWDGKLWTFVVPDVLYNAVLAQAANIRGIV